MGPFERIHRYFRTRVLPYFSGDRRLARMAFIDSYRFPDAVLARFAAEHPALDEEARARVFTALKAYFSVCAVAPDMIAGMPSRIVDKAWHTFALFPREYEAFCERAFGCVLHTTPDETMAGSERSEAALHHTWRVVCARERIDARQPSRLPSLFAIDRRLKVADGRYWTLNDTDEEAARQMLGAVAILHIASIVSGAAGWTDAEGMYAALSPVDGFSALSVDFGGGGDFAGDMGGGGGDAGGGGT